MRDINNKRRNLLVQASSIKFKIPSSGNHSLFFNEYFEWCDPIRYPFPDEVIINGKNITKITNYYNFITENNEITIKWNSPLTYTSCMFKDNTAITEIDLSEFDDSELLNMQYMFIGCKSLEKINISKMKAPKVSSIGSFFRDCIKLKSINLENFNASNLGQFFHYNFRNCYELETLIFPYINTYQSVLSCTNIL